MATLAAAVYQAQDPALSLVAASVIEIVRQVNIDGARLRTIEEKLEAATKEATSFVRLCGTTQPALPPPPGRRWILGLLCAVLAVAILLPVYVVFYAVMFPEKWSAHKDAVIKAYANSFMYHASMGVWGETLVQRKNRLIAEQQRLQQKRMQEEERRKREEEQKKQREEYEGTLRLEALAESTMTPWQSFLYRNNVGDCRFQRYRHP
ncbi:hypothetical protein C2845_PM05G14220 [Panicum miliaceum]|uniref:Uncharacterized protein n=1 Tax=Panicum miliaceum TaxID=4540 RepID=A0A3L6T5D2_PANMI|nr:hypothetical protein C2845_PM05G14220 [Panicum miliaceum]